MCIQEILSQSAWPSLTYKPNTSQENAQNGAGGQGAVERGGGGKAHPNRGSKSQIQLQAKATAAFQDISVLEEMEKKGYGWEFLSTVLGLYYTLEVYYTLEDNGPKK